MVLKKQSHIYISSLVLGAPVTFALFLLMAHLVSQPAKLGESSESSVINFSRSMNFNEVQTKTRSLPKAPPKPQEAPKMPKMAIKAQVDAPTPQMAMNVPMIANSLSLGDGPYLGGATGGPVGANENRAVMPLVRIEPQYPRQAAMRGIEGYVQVEFDVNETGAVENLKILGSKPPRIFDQSAKRAILKWKYNPKIVDGKPVTMKNIRVQQDFKLAK